MDCDWTCCQRCWDLEGRHALQFLPTDLPCHATCQTGELTAYVAIATTHFASWQGKLLLPIRTGRGSDFERASQVSREWSQVDLQQNATCHHASSPWRKGRPMLLKRTTGSLSQGCSNLHLHRKISCEWQHLSPHSLQHHRNREDNNIHSIGSHRCRTGWHSD